MRWISQFLRLAIARHLAPVYRSCSATQHPPSRTLIEVSDWSQEKNAQIDVTAVV
jgi:hypothetical protein